MANVLFLVHRIPFPPNKGDKVRSYHLLEELRRRHRVFLGTFVDDPDDEPHVATLESRCADVYAARLNPKVARLESLSGLLSGSALTLAYYRDRGLRRWVLDTVAREHIDGVLVFSSSMAPYAEGLAAPTLVDFVDVDSAKWMAYANHHRWPLSWLYRREGRRLLEHERAVAARARRSFFVTDMETQLFAGLAPECAARLQTSGNGVDADHFRPDPARPSPFGAGEVPVVFTGAMDYWPNIDAAAWFAQDMLPSLLKQWPRLRFHIVGRSPSAAVQALAGPHVNVTGTVPDVRPYLQHAAVVVAPLRLARGIQNKVLEAMAMARPVVGTANCTAQINAQDGVHLVSATDPESFVRAVSRLLSDADAASAIGERGRERVLAAYTWEAQLACVEQQLLAGLPRAA